MKQERADPREIEGRQALFVVNLAPRKMKGRKGWCSISAMPTVSRRFSRFPKRRCRMVQERDSCIQVGYTRTGVLFTSVRAMGNIVPAPIFPMAVNSLRHRKGMLKNEMARSGFDHCGIVHCQRVRSDRQSCSVISAESGRLHDDILKKEPGFDNAKLGVFESDGFSLPYLQYRSPPDRQGRRITVSFGAELDCTTVKRSYNCCVDKSRPCFVALLQGLFAPPNSGPPDGDVHVIVEKWNTQCKVFATAIFE